MRKNLFALAAIVVFSARAFAATAEDRAAADTVAALIDAIYVQKRTERTDAQCAEAKRAWDALTDGQKALVRGENADPDYFGRDTGDARADDPLNQNRAGENEILVVSFGTSFNTSRAEDIGGVERAIQAANPGWIVRRAFTSQIIINHIQARDGEKIDNMEQALERAARNGVKNLVVQPTHLMRGSEYDDMVRAVQDYADAFEKIAVAEPLLGKAGRGADETNADKRAVAKAAVAQAVKEAGFTSLAAARKAGTAFVFMGHGTSHSAKVCYSQMAAQMKALKYGNVFIGTVEGEPEETSCGNVIEAVKGAGFTDVVLCPLMVVAGDHANNDMAGDDDESWKTRFRASGAFTAIDCQLAGLGSIPDIQKLYVRHTKAALAELKSHAPRAAAQSARNVPFRTDSPMFHANEAHGGMGILSEKDGKMTVHVSLAGKKILNLYAGTAADARNDEAHWLHPSEDVVVYSDGLEETVFGFDIPVEKLGEAFPLAILGEKGVWHDHMVTVGQ